MPPGMDSWRSESPYRELPPNRKGTLYSASCYCKRVKYSVQEDPLNAKLCHCRDCQKLHGAPMEWVAIFDKPRVFFETASLDFLYFYNADSDEGWTSVNASERNLPVKVSCSHCRSPIADEGRNMWMAYCTLFDDEKLPASFQHSCHLFYPQRCFDVNDGRDQWTGHRNKSPKCNQAASVESQK